MDWVEALGFLAAFLMFSTFYMRNMIPLRIIGMSSNAAFIVYAAIAQVWPLFVLHVVLLPMNFVRLLQMIRLIKQVKHASESDMSLDFLVPHMKSEEFHEDDVVFRRGDEADKFYVLKRGTIRVEELDVTLQPGEIIGEMGVFSIEQKRLATLRCESDVELLSMTGKEIKQLYYQNPRFGFYLIQLLLKRFERNRMAGKTQLPSDSQVE